jgi:hypothetical protein
VHHHTCSQIGEKATRDSTNLPVYPNEFASLELGRKKNESHGAASVAFVFITSLIGRI